MSFEEGEEVSECLSGDSDEEDGDGLVGHLFYVDVSVEVCEEGSEDEEANDFWSHCGSDEVGGESGNE